MFDNPYQRAAAATVIGAGLLIAGCTGPDEETTGSTTTSNANKTTFFDALDSAGIAASPTSVDTAESVCIMLDHSPIATVFPSAVTQLMDEGYTAYEAGGFVGAAVFAYCDEHVAEAMEYARQYGG